MTPNDRIAALREQDTIPHRITLIVGEDWLLQAALLEGQDNPDPHSVKTRALAVKHFMALIARSLWTF